MSQIKVTIDKFGNPVIEGVGFTGTNCKAATKPIEDAFAGGKGGVAVLDKPELHMTGETQQQEQMHL